MKLRIQTLEQLVELLVNCNVPFKNWGVDAERRVMQLWHEVRDGEAKVTCPKDKKIRRAIRTALLDVYYHDYDAGLIYQLVEDRQVYDGDPIPRRRNKDSSVSEKLLANEKVNTQGIARALREELGIFGPVFIDWAGTYKEKRDSKKYPGIETISKNIRFRVMITKDQYKPEGYIEYRDGVTTYFVWKPYSPTELNMGKLKRTGSENSSPPVFNLAKRKSRSTTICLEGIFGK